MFQFIDDFKETDVDVCIIGSGFAGLAVANHFLEKQANNKIIIFESAGHWHGKINAYAYGVFPPKDPYKLYSGLSKGWIGKTCPQYCESSRALAYGGTANIWSGWFWPFEKRDFYKHTKFQWPINYEDLFPYYRLTQSFLGLGNFDYEDHHFSSPILKTSFFSTRNIQFHPVRPHHSLSTIISNSRNIQVIRNATFIGFEKNQSGNEVELTHAIFSSIKEGRINKKIKVRSRFFVFAMGALENTRQLLIEDLGNQNNQLGKNFIEHFYMWEGAKFSLNKIKTKVKNFYFPEVPHSLENGTGWLPALVSSSNLEKSEDINGFRILLGGEEKIEMTLNICCEQDPNFKSKIELSKYDFDQFNRPYLVLNPDTNKKDERTIINSIVKSVEYLESEKVIKNLILPDLNQSPFSWKGLGQIVPGNHPMGTTRIATSSNEGVADINCKVFGTKNLYLTGSSCFPTGGSGNPTFTIVALALRLAKHLESLLFPKEINHVKIKFKK